MNSILISKVRGISFFQYKGNAIRLGQSIPHTVDEVIIGIRDQKDTWKKITTFKDSKGNIIERIFDYPNRPIWNRLYESTENDIRPDETVLSTTKHDYMIERDAFNCYKFLSELLNIKQFSLWKLKKITTDHVSYNLDNDEIILTQVVIKNKPKSSRAHHSFIEFPKIKRGKKISSEPKKLSFDVRDNGSVISETISTSNKYIIPKNDNYLGYRALPIEDAKIPFVRYFLKERNMDDKNITVNTRFNSRYYVNNEFMAIFDAEEGIINFNQDHEISSKAKLVNISRHEVEHAWQYFLQGLLNGGGSSWQSELARKFGKITNKKVLKEAQNYNRSIKTYVPFYENPGHYKQNYIEIKAREKGKLAQEEYNTYGQDIKNIFKHIPSKFL